MAVKTTINLAYLDEVWHTLRLNNRTELFHGAGLARGYGTKLRDKPEMDVRLSTVDKLHNYIEMRMTEMRQVVPDDLWDRLIVHGGE